MAIKILSASQIKEVDAYTILHEPIASIDLMERAAAAFTEWFVSKFDVKHRTYIVCGTGNNGGDGMAVGRMLYDRGYEVFACVVGLGKGSEDFQINYEKLIRDITIPVVQDKNDLPAFKKTDVIIDAIFGSGLSRQPSGVHAFIINKMNVARAIRVSVDISSGLYCDSSSLNNISVKADYTVSFQLPKMAFLMPENDACVGEWHVVDIGLDREFIKRKVTHFHLLTEIFLRPFIFPRNKHAHKGNFGKGLLITGSYGKMGASVLASGAFMRSGAGLLTVLAPKCGYDILQTSVPEVMVLTSGKEIIENKLPSLEGYDAVGIGPGIGTHEKTVKAIKRILQLAGKPVVIDADGLNILAENRKLLDIVPARSILTPHPKEFERLTGTVQDGFSRIKKLKQFSKKLNCYVILKGAHTAIATPEGNIYFNPTGNPGMATGGSGDVLTGIITSLLAQHQSPFHAAILGVYLHGLAGDFAKEKMGEEGLIASDINRNIPEALAYLHRNV